MDGGGRKDGQGTKEGREPWRQQVGRNSFTAAAATHSSPQGPRRHSQPLPPHYVSTAVKRSQCVASNHRSAGLVYPAVYMRRACIPQGKWHAALCAASQPALGTAGLLVLLLSRMSHVCLPDWSGMQAQPRELPVRLPACLPGSCMCGLCYLGSDVETGLEDASAAALEIATKAVPVLGT